MMNDRGKSDRSVVPEKLPNNADNHAAEVVEGRDRAKGNSSKRDKPWTLSQEGLPSALERVGQAARQDRKLRFTALLHHIYDVDRLGRAYYAVKRDAAAGIDGETWQHYGENLKENLEDLSGRLGRGAYRARPVRRAYIEKADGRKRPLGVPVLEDKIVQRSAVEVLNAIYEVDFLGFSYGFRPGRSQHQALDAVAYGMWKKMVKWILDADLQSFFDTLKHEWLVKFLEYRIADRRVMRLIQKWLNAGVLEDGKRMTSEIGTVQGGSISPLLANIYLHYVLDLWIEQWRKRRARGDVLVVRFADDFVVGFQHRKEAEQLIDELRERFAKFGLKLHPEKTRLIEFGRFAIPNRQARGEGKPETFNFLGFTHYCGTDLKGKFTVVRKTMRQRMLKKLTEVNLELRQRRHQPMDEQGRYVQALIRGHLNYYGVPFNSRAIRAFRVLVIRLWKKWLSRRSQKGYLAWDRMERFIDRWVPPAVICHSYPSARFGG
ncbi:MAG TPA: group II intron reverse transcriptase/maturase [Terriglobales bacterium]|nr:group II intron reverse transcriptase/maturase [Terriglobales bacterium]